MDPRDGVHSELLDAYTHSFVIKIWLEETAIEAKRSVWRGHITHVPSAKRRYIENLDDASLFILHYLQELNVKPSFYWQVRKWLKNQSTSQKPKT